ncbi:hypothetical protein C8Q74DRAFT_300590 [Fomes fomentarius]|nr:hypothetical protein C8Q74DRAFT_300590 [Fomes fomentarius]
MEDARRVRGKLNERVTRELFRAMHDAAGRWQQRAIDRRASGTFRTARGGVRSLWLASSRGSDRGCGSEGGRPDAPDCTTPPFSPRPFPTHGPFRVQTLTNLTLNAQTSPHT